MAKFYLINTVLLGTTKLLPGALIDDALYDTAAIAAAGGTLMADDSGGAALISGAAAKAATAKLRGASEFDLGQIMQAALAGIGTTEDVAQDSAMVKYLQVVITQAAIAAKGAVTSGTFDAATAFPANARLLGTEVSVGTKVQNVGDTDVTTFDVGTDGASKSGICGTAFAKTAGLKAGIGDGIAVGGEKGRVTLNSSVNLSTITAGAITVTYVFAVPAAG